MTLTGDMLPLRNKLLSVSVMLPIKTVTYCYIPDKFIKFKKYQGVKEFHMLAHIGCNCKIMVFSPLKLEVTYYHSSKAIKP